VRGASGDDARQRLVGSATTLAGLLKHLAWVELEWFQRVLAGRSLPPVPSQDADPDAEFRVDHSESVDQLIADYQQACDQSRATAANLRLGRHRPASPHGPGLAALDLCPHDRGGPPATLAMPTSCAS
jgi:uncharacterized damage-inducible protein DinB